MTEHEVFETRLRAALAIHVANGPADFDAHEFARAVAEAEPRRHGRTIALRRPRIVIPRIAWVVVATALLITALVASALFAGARPFAGPSTWQRIVLPAPAGSAGRMADVVRAGSGYLAVGSTCTHCGGDIPGIVWTSRDGLAWDLVETGDTFADAELNAVVAGDGGFVAVGSNRLDARNPNGSVATSAAAWVSADGRTWRRAASITAPDGAVIARCRVRTRALRCRRLGAPANISSPGSGSPMTPTTGFPAAGFDAAPSFMGVMTGVAAGGPASWRSAWIPASGCRPTAVPGPRRAQSASDALTHPVSVTAGRDGLIVVGASPAIAAGSDFRGRQDVDLGCPSSPEGRPPSELPLEPGGIVATDWGFVALSTWSPEMGWGGYQEGDPIDVQGGLWTSRDGITWTPHRLNPQFAAAQTPEVTQIGDEMWVSNVGSPALVRGGDAIIVSTDAGTWVLPGAAVSEAAIP